MIRVIAGAFALACAFALALAAQQKPPKHWTEWSRKDVEKVLNDSPWGRTQVETDTSEMFYSPTAQGQAAPSSSARATTATGQSSAPGGSLAGGRTAEGALNQSTSVKFHIRWFSARPIRRAMAREVALRDGRMTDQLAAFADGPIETRTVIAVTFEASDRRFGAKALEAFNAANTATLKNNTYLERRDGTRVFLGEYIPPSGNTIGAALFVFPRTLGERPLLSSDTGDVRFFSEFSRALRLDMRFKVSEMIYEGRLEY